MITIIAAIGKNRELGKNNQLLWHIKADLERFKKLTLGNVVIMGRKTYQSLPEKFRPLPQRINIVVSKQKDFVNDPIIIAQSIEEAIKKAKEFKKEIFIAGGASIYEQTLPLADKLYLTLVEKEFPDADVFFPPFEKLFPKKIKEEIGQEGELTFRFLEYSKT